MATAFDVPAENYDSLIGRYLPELAPRFADAAGVRSCGLTGELFRRDAVTVAVEPEQGFAQSATPAIPARPCTMAPAGNFTQLGTPFS